jgi:hypothetical protein
LDVFENYLLPPRIPERQETIINRKDFFGVLSVLAVKIPNAYLDLIKTETIATFSTQQTLHKHSQAGSPRSVPKNNLTKFPQKIRVYICKANFLDFFEEINNEKHD